MTATYKYKGIQSNQYTEGKISALNEDEAAYKLKEQKIIITHLEKFSGNEEVTEKKVDPKKATKVSKKVPIHEVIVFTKKLETMVRAGLPILETIAMIEKQTDHQGLRWIIEDIHQSIESGTPLSDSFAKHDQVFDNIYVNLLRAGESSGKIDLFLKKLVINMEKEEKIRRSIKGALTYPTVLLIVAMSVIVLMMVFVVPVFKGIFENVEGGLPLATQIVVNISDFLTDPIKGGLLGVSIVSVVIILLTLIKKNYKIRRSWHKFILKVPLVGDLSRKSALSKIAMIQGNLSAAGVPVLEALDIAASSNNNIIIREAMIEIKRGVFSGEPLSELYQKNPSIFEPSFVAMVAVGEKTGNMEEMFGAIANYYEEEMDVTITRLTSMLEPIMIVFMGITIGFILIAMYTPLFSIGKAI